MTRDGATITPLRPADAAAWGGPVSLGPPPVAGEVRPGLRTRRVCWPAAVAPHLAAATTLAVVAAVVGRHAGQRRFQLGSDLGLGPRVYRLGVDLDADPRMRTVVADAGAALADPAGRPGDRAPVRGPGEAVLVRHRYWHGAGEVAVEPGALDLHFRWLAGDFALDVRYDARSFDGAFAELLLDHLTAALRLAGDPTVTVFGLPLADERERRAVAEWGGTATVSRPAQSIPELVREQALRRPASVAVTGADGRQLTYAELVARTEQLAGALVERGVGPETVVVVHADRSAELVATLLGVLAAGGAYLALDPRHTPGARLAEIVHAAGAELVATDRDVSSSPVPVVDLAALTATRPGAAPWAPVDVRGLAYVSYTSGSTGTPKGVAVTHEAVARLVRGFDQASLGPGEAVLFLSPVAFDASTLEIWGPLCNGGRVVVHPPGPVRLDELAGLLRRTGVTTAWFTAGLFHRLVDAEPGAFAGLRHVVAGGDVVSDEHLRRLRAAHPGLRFTNGYGPTENTTFTTCWTAAGPPEVGSVPIGRPIPGTTVVLLDQDLRPVPVGVPGELYAGGVGLARGYLHQPALTADRFVPDPTSSTPGGRLYRTGDLARWRPDGQLEFRGRADTQVKVRGYRVEPTEVEAVLARQPGVAEAVVVAETDRLAGRRLTAYVLLDGPARDTARAQVAAAELRRRLGEKLPAYLVPSVIVPMTELPMTGSGKVDRARLAVGMRSPRVLDLAYVAPRTETEVRLAAIWADLLRVDPVGVDDDFFDLGGHSLAVSQLIQEVEVEFSTRVKARTVFLRPTVASLAEVLGDALVPVGPGGSDADGGTRP